MSKKTTTTITKQELPAWYNQMGEHGASLAYQATSEPYQAYGAPRIAGFAPEQEQAFQTIQSGVGGWKPYVGAAGEAATQGLQSWTTPGVAQAYMSPYIGSVVRGIGESAGRNLYENILPNINRTFVGGGTFGGSRNAEFVSRAIRDTQSQALAKQMEALNTGYNTAADIYGSEANRALTGAGILSGLGEQYQTLTGREAAGLEAVGSQRQGLAQRSADLSYQDFLTQRGYPLEMAKEYAGIVRNLAPNIGGTTTQTSTAPGASKTASTIGAIGSAIGTLGSIFAKDGGAITHKRGLGWLKEVA